MTSLAIRDAEAGDLPAILALHNHHILATTSIWRTQAADLAERGAWLEERRAKGYPVLVAEEGGAFLGYASYGDFRTGEGYSGTVENSVYVLPEAQGRGVARALMEALFERARAGGKRVMMAGIGLPNDASVSLHRRLGFEERARLPGVGRKFGRDLDLLLMQKAL